VNFQQGGETIVPLGNGTLDFAGVAVGAAAFNAIERGVKIRLAADKGAHRPGFISVAMAIRKDLITSGAVKTWADLKGRKISIPAPGNTAAVYADVALKRGGLTAKDVELVVLPFAETGVALANKSIDAGVVAEPFQTQWEAQGISQRLPDTNDVYPGLQSSVLVYGSTFVGEVANRFTLAYVRGIRDYLDAFTKGKDKEEIIGIMIKVTTLKDRALYDKMGLSGFDPDGYINAKDLDAQQEYYLRTGDMPKKIDMAKIVDNSHCDYAVAQLGPYR
jgi:NitT/TauT family transport system substrate-binding protein